MHRRLLGLQLHSCFCWGAPTIHLRSQPQHGGPSIKLNVCYFCLFLKKTSKSNPSLLCTLGTARDGMTPYTHTWPAMTLQHSVSRNIQLCPVIGMSTCKLQVGRSRVSRALSTPAEHTGRLMQSQICSPYPRHASSWLQISAGVNQCYYLCSSCAELRTWQYVSRQEVGQCSFQGHEALVGRSG